VSCRREQAEALLTFCESTADVLVTFSDEEWRAAGTVLAFAKGDIEKALRSSAPDVGHDDG